MKLLQQACILIICVSTSGVARDSGAADAGTNGVDFPGAEAEHLVDGLLEVPNSHWAAQGAPNWVDIDLGAPYLVDSISVAPFAGHPGNPYFYNESWTVQYLNPAGSFQDFSNVVKTVGAGTLSGPGIGITNGDPGTTESVTGYKYYEFQFDPVLVQHVRYTVTVGDRDGDSNGAELEVYPAWPSATPIQFTGTANDVEDGDVTPSLQWTSDLDGLLGVGGSFMTSSLSVGEHSITATATDSMGLQGSTGIVVTVVDDLPPATFALTVGKSGAGSGTVTSAPAGINCGADCSETYTDGTVVTLTAAPQTGSTFAGWSGDADCNDGSVTMSTARNCTATFDLLSFTLSVAKAGTGTGTVSSTPAGIDCGGDCSQSYDYGTAVTLNPVPSPDSTFEGWSGDADCNDGSVTMSAARNCTATFDLLPPATFALTVGRSGAGSGTVTSVPAGIDCGADCSETYTDGTVVTLTAAPQTGSTFSGWSGDADCNDGSVTMSAARNCTATFDLQSFTLSVAKAGTGTGTVSSTPGGIDCGGDCSQSYDYGTAVTLNPVPSPDSTFVGWSGDADCTDGSVTMSAARNCTATFDLLPPATFALTVSRSGAGSGTVTSVPAGINCGADCSETYTDGTVVTLTAAPQTGSTFSGWSGDADCNDGSVTMSAARNCTATFDLQSFTLSVAKAGTGTGTVSSTPGGIDCGGDCSQSYDYGTAVTLNPVPSPDSTFVGWSGDGDCSDGQVTVTQNLSCTATFDLLPPSTFALTVSRSGAGSGTVTSVPSGINCGADCSETYTDGTVVTLTAAPQTGSTFAGWSGDTDCNDGIVTLDINRNCTATFDLQSFTLSVAKIGTGTGTVSSTPGGIDCGGDCSESYGYGAAVTLNPVPSPDSTFVGWSGAGDCSDGQVTVTQDLSCTATFDLTPPETRVLSVGKNGAGSGTVTSAPVGINCGGDCSEEYDVGTVVVLTPSADVGSVFADWSGHGDCNDGSVRMNSNRTCTARFDLQQPDSFALTVAKSGAGSGTVTSAPSGINCGADCSETYTDGTVVTLTAAPQTGSTFSGWSGDADCNDGSVTMSAARNCTATFDLQSFTLSVAKSGTGTGTVTSTPAGIDCGGDCSESYGYGAAVTLNPVPSPDSTFVGWSGAGDCNDGQVTVTQNLSCTATFDLLPPATFALTVSRSGAGSGTVTSAPAGINCGADCSETYTDGTVVTLTAAPQTGSTFAGWSGDGDCSDGQVTVTQNLSCTATFDLQQPDSFALTVSRSGAGSGTVTSVPAGINCGADCSETYTDGTVVTLTASPQTGSMFAGWSGHGDCSDGIVTMNSDRSCTATFNLSAAPSLTIEAPVVNPALGSPVSSDDDEFPNGDAEKLVDGAWDVFRSNWASRGAPAWVEVDLGAQATLTGLTLRPFAGSPGRSYYYNEAWNVQYRDSQGAFQAFTNVQKLAGAGDLAGPGIAITNGDPGTDQSNEAFKFYDFSFDPVSTQVVRFNVTGGDRDGDSNGSELELRQAYVEGTQIDFVATASDPEEGDLTAGIGWTSDVDGAIGSGGSISVSSLSVGNHSITALVADSSGQVGQAAVEVVILPWDSVFEGFEDSFESGDMSAWSSVAP